MQAYGVTVYTPVNLERNVMSRKKKVQSPAAKAMYAPKPKPAVSPVRQEVADPLLKRLASSALDALKLPGAIPSDVILAALVKAKQLGANP